MSPALFRRLTVCHMAFVAAVACALCLSFAPPPSVLEATELQALCGTDRWRRIQLQDDSSVETLAGDGERVFAGTRVLAPGAKLFAGGPQDSGFAPLAGFLNSNDNPISVADVALGTGGALHVAVVNGGVTSSSDGGATFDDPALIGYGVTAMTATPEGLLVAASAPNDRGIYLRDAIGSWVTVAGPGSFPDGGFWSLATGPDGRQWAAMEDNGLWRRDDTTGFAQVGDVLLRASTVLSVAIDPVDANLVYVGLGDRTRQATAAYHQRGLHVSRDGGRTWRSSLPWGTGSPLVFAIATVNVTGHAFAATWGSGILRTTNGGRTWHPVGLDPAMADEVGRGFFSSVLAVRPPDSPGCQILLAGGHAGLWVKDIGNARFSTVLLPVGHRGFDTVGVDASFSLKSVITSGLPGHGTSASVAGEDAAPTPPVAPWLAPPRNIKSRRQ